MQCCRPISSVAMGILACKWVSAFFLSCSLLLSGALSGGNIRGVNLGGWLVVERWMTPYLFDGIPNGDMLDGGQVQFKSVVLQKYITAENGGGSTVTVDRTDASAWETFKLWRVSESTFQFRSYNGQFLSCEGEICSAMAKSPLTTETFEIEKNSNGRVHIKLLNGRYVQATSSDQLTANYQGVPGWDDNMATFEITILQARLGGEYQLSNGLGPDKAQEIITEHRRSYITEENFRFLAQNGINTVRIPVGWWIVEDPTPQPFVGGSLNALDNAFSWAQNQGLRCIIDLHAAPGSQNGMEHSASRDGSLDWQSPDHISKSLEVIEKLASRYASHSALLGIELLNEPWAPQVSPLAPGVSMGVLVPYYSRGYEIVRKYSPTAYVIVCQRIASEDQMELFHANIGSSNLVVDLHWYNQFDKSFDHMSIDENIRFIYNTRRGQIQSSNGANGPLVFIGEWVNKMVVDASKTDYQTFGKAQLDVYGEASFGWAYWSFKNANKPWSLKWNIENEYLSLGKTPTK